MVKSKIINLNFNLKEDYKYLVFLSALVLFFFVVPILGLENLPVVNHIFYIMMVFSSIPIIKTRSTHEKRMIIGLAVTGILATSIDFFFDLSESHKWLTVLVLLIFSLYFAILFRDLVVQVINSSVITFNVVFGAFTGYILLGIIGFFIFRIIYLVQPGSFNITETPFDDLMYYSFITLTTIGYGDISPLLPSARYFAVLLGLFGQFYNVIILAFIVGKFLQSQS